MDEVLTSIEVPTWKGCETIEVWLLRELTASQEGFAR